MKALLIRNVSLEIGFFLIFSACSKEAPYDTECCDNKVGKCGENEGDCDDDSQCKPGLICIYNSCPLGSESNFNAGTDCCINPGKIIDYNIKNSNEKDILCNRIFILVDKNLT